MAGATPGGGLQTAIMALPTGDPCNTPPDPCLFFSPDSESQVSNVFTVGLDDDPLQVLAFGLREGEKVTLEMVAGLGGNEFFAPVVIGNLHFEIEYPNNVMLVPLAGRFQLRFSGVLGELTVVCQPTTCCMVQIFPKEIKVLTPHELAGLLSFKSCEGLGVVPGTSLATCVDLNHLRAELIGLIPGGVTIPPSFTLVTAPPVAPPVAGQPTLAVNSTTSPFSLYAFSGGTWHLLGDGAGGGSPVAVPVQDAFGVFQVNGF